MGKARIVSGGSNGSYQIEIKQDTRHMDTRLAEIATMLSAVTAKVTDLEDKRTTARAELTDAVTAMNAAIDAARAANPIDTALIDGLYDQMTAKVADIQAKEHEINSLWSNRQSIQDAIDAAEQAEVDARADYQQAQAALSAYVADTGDNSSGYYLSMAADVENKLTIWQDAQANTVAVKAANQGAIAYYDGKLQTARDELKALQADLRGLQQQSDAACQAMANYELDMGPVDAAGKIAIEKNAALQLVDRALADNKRKKLELEKEQAWLNKAKTQAAETRQAWCADYTENLSGEVGTIEIAQEWQGVPPIIIRPGYSGRATYSGTRDGALNKLQNMSPHSAWFNMALYPAVAKWKPQYRRGTLTAKSGNYGTVVLEDTYSSATQVTGGVAKIAINQKPTTLLNVLIEYMTCNGEAFNVGDKVVVEFQNRYWSQPKVIGFVDNPKECFTWPQYFQVNASNVGTGCTLSGAIAYEIASGVGSFTIQADTTLNFKLNPIGDLGDGFNANWSGFEFTFSGTTQFHDGSYVYSCGPGYSVNLNSAIVTDGITKKTYISLAYDKQSISYIDGSGVIHLGTWTGQGDIYYQQEWYLTTTVTKGSRSKLYYVALDMPHGKVNFWRS